MASVHNSYHLTIAAAGEYPTPATRKVWEDIQSYTSVIITAEANKVPVTVKVQWVNSDDDTVPTYDETPLVTDTFIIDTADTVVTKQFDTRARWVRVVVTTDKINTLLRLATTYKKAPTEIKLTDDTTNIVSVNLGDNEQNSLYTVLTDMSGQTLKSTGLNQTGEALYTHLADNSGDSLATTSTYRDINRVDFSHYVFSRSENAGNGGLTVGETTHDTIVHAEKSFRVHTDRLSVKDGDVVQMLTLRHGESEPKNLADIFASDTTTDVSGHIKITGQIKYVAREPNHVRFQVLTNENTSNWFSGVLALGQGANALTTVSFNDMNGPGQPHWGVCGETFRFVDTSLVDTADRVALAKVDDYYNIIADMSGFNSSGAGLTVSGTPYLYPLDTRLIRGSLEHDTPDTSTTTIFRVIQENNPLESLAVGLRDSCNSNLSSTGLGETTYLFDAHNVPSHKILYLIDKTEHYDGVDDQNKFEAVVGSLVAESINKMTAISTLVTHSDGGADSFKLQTYGVAYHNQVDVADADKDEVALEITTGNVDDLVDNDRFKNIEDTAAIVNYWGALVKFLDNGYAGTDPNNVPFATDFDTIILQTSTADSNHIANADTCRNIFDTCGWFDGVTKIAVAPAVTPDMLSFVGGNTDNIYIYDPAKGVHLMAQDVSGIAAKIADKLFKTAHIGSNALTVHTADANGVSQAGTRPVTDARFGDVALYYALADNCGSIIDTTKTAKDRPIDSTENNALYVHLTSTKQGEMGKSIYEHNPLPIKFTGDVHDGLTFDLTVSGQIVTNTDISSIDFTTISGYNLQSLGIANETAVPIWLKVYDISKGEVDSIRDEIVDDADPSGAGLQHRIKFNFPVPATDYRDLQFAKSVKFDRGIHFVASTNYKYDDLSYPPGNKHIFVHGTYSEVTESS